MSNDDVIMASNAADAEAVDRQRSAIAELLGRVSILESSVVRGAAAGGPAFDESSRALKAFVDDELRPWLQAAGDRLLPQAFNLDRARLLVEGLAGELRMIEETAGHTATGDPARAAANVGGLRLLLEVFFGKISDILLPALAEDSSVSLTELTSNLPTAAETAEDEHGHGGCACAEHDEAEPELDVRQIPHAIRHATVFGAFDAIAPGGAMILIAHHDPIPLLHQLHDRASGRLRVEYIESGPEAWRLRLTRL